MKNYSKRKQFEGIEKIGYRIPETAFLLGVSESTVKRAIKSEQLKSVKINGCTIILRSEIDRFLSENSQAA